MLDQYQLIDRIGVGGMAEVWRATMRGAEGFERPIAIKRILPHYATDADFVAMFVDEAKIAVRLSHPNVVQIFDLGRVGDEWFIAMEYVHGKDVRAVCDAEAARGQRLPLEVACHIVLKMCEALHHAHFLDANPFDPSGTRQIIHRDVSPQNVLVSYEGEVKVADFGLAKAVGRAGHTQAGTIKGKLAYMSPEQLRGMTLDQRSDVFAVGIVLWELLSGDRLFLGANDRDTITKAFACKVPSLVATDPSLDPELERIVKKALAEDREQRYQTAEELREELESFVYGAELHLSGASLAAYMRALFADPAPARRRDQRAVTAQLQVPTHAEAFEDLDELVDEDLLESEPAPRPRSEKPVGTTPAEASSLDPEYVDALDQSLRHVLAQEELVERSSLSAPRMPSPAPASLFDDEDDFGNATLLGDVAMFRELAAAREAVPAAEEPDDEAFGNVTLALDDRTLALSGVPPELLLARRRAAEAENAEREPAEDLVITRMVRPNARDLAASRPIAPPEAGSATVPREARAPYDGFGEDDETTTGIGRRR